MNRAEKGCGQGRMQKSVKLVELYLDSYSRNCDDGALVIVQYRGFPKSLAPHINQYSHQTGSAQGLRVGEPSTLPF